MFNANFMRLKDRIASFVIPIGRRKQTYAEAGFFYLNERISCFCCGITLMPSVSNAWKFHAQRSPRCVYLIKKRGKDFANRAENLEGTPKCKICFENDVEFFFSSVRTHNLLRCLRRKIDMLSAMSNDHSCSFSMLFLNYLFQLI